MRHSCTYKLAGPKTFRRASTKILKRWGNNLQNVEKGMREMFLPDGPFLELQAKCKYWLDTGDTSVFTEEELVSLRVFVQSDQSGADDLVVSYDCAAGNSRDCYTYGIKKHVYVAMRLFDYIWKKKMKEKGGLVEDFNIQDLIATPISKLKENPFWHDLNILIRESDNWPLTERYYYFAKQTVHSANYDIQAPNFRMNVLEKSGGKIYISKEDSERFLVTYRSIFPEIPARNQRVARQVQETRMLFNHFGHPYIITDYNLSDSKMKEYYAWCPQSTVGEITRTAFSSLYEYIESEHKRWDLLQDNHDSYLVQCPLTEVAECRQQMAQCMNIKLTSPIDNVEYRMKSEQNVGFNWAPFKAEKNLLGLRELTWLS